MLEIIFMKTDIKSETHVTASVLVLGTQSRSLVISCERSYQSFSYPSAKGCVTIVQFSILCLKKTAILRFPDFFFLNLVSVASIN